MDSKKQRQGLISKDKWPSPLSVLTTLGIKPASTNRAGYFIIRCPFHKNGQEKDPSMNVHSVSGHYRCYTCMEHGGDILAFYQKVTGKGFIEAAKALGIWEVK